MSFLVPREKDNRIINIAFIINKEKIYQLFEEMPGSRQWYEVLAHVGGDASAA